MTQRAPHGLNEEDLELRAAAYAVVLGIGALALLIAALIVALMMALA